MFFRLGSSVQPRQLKTDNNCIRAQSGNSPTGITRFLRVLYPRRTNHSPLNKVPLLVRLSAHCPTCHGFEALLTRNGLPINGSAIFVKNCYSSLSSPSVPSSDDSSAASSAAVSFASSFNSSTDMVFPYGLLPETVRLGGWSEPSIKSGPRPR